VKITKRQLKRIIREEKRVLLEFEARGDVYQGTLWTYALSLCHDKFAELRENEPGDADHIGVLLGENLDQLVDVLCDFWVTDHDMFKDYPGDIDAMWEALRDAGEILMQEAYQEFLINME